MNLKFSCLKSLTESSPNAKVYVLVNKMDKLDEEKRNIIFSMKKDKLEAKAGNFKINFYETSIWEISLYKAFSNILSNIIKNKIDVKKLLEEYYIACDANEVILFDKSTLIPISDYNNKEIKDEERFEKMCYLMKKFKSNIKKFNELIIKNKSNTILFDEFIDNAYIMVISSNKNISLELLRLNLEIIKKKFQDVLNN